MNKNEMEKYRSMLLKEKNKINETIEDMKVNGLSRNQREEIDELSVIDNHPADMGTEMFDKERGYALLDNEKSILTQIDEAINRIENGTYGKCELCGKEIQSERIKFMPYVLTCMDCESKKPDYITYRYDRPVEEKILAPLGMYFNDNNENDKMKDEVEYNAEDSWQDVDRNNARSHIKRNYDDEIDESGVYGEGESDEGVVEFTDTISNQYYKNQLP